MKTLKCTVAGCAEAYIMGRTLALLVVSAVVLSVQSWPSDEGSDTNSDLEEPQWSTETGNTEGAAATSEEERRGKRQDSDGADATSLKHLAIEKALTARKIPPTHKGEVYTYSSDT